MMMRRYLILLLFITSIAKTYAQKTEFSFTFQSGLFRFTGNGTQNASFIDFSTATNRGFTSNPYGKKAGISTGFTTVIKRVSPKNLFYAINAGYELHRSSTPLNKVTVDNGLNEKIYDANGSTVLKLHFINIFPQAGYRVQSKNFYFDFSGGFDIGLGLGAREVGKATTNAGIFTTAYERDYRKTDIRPRFMVLTAYKRIGFTFGYSLGLMNYTKNFPGNNGEIYSRIARFGLQYKLN